MTSINPPKNHIKKSTGLLSSFSYGLLCAGALVVSFEVGAANIDCSTDLIFGDMNGSLGLYGSCISAPYYLGIVDAGGGTGMPSIRSTTNPSAPTPARDLGNISSANIVSMGTTKPTFANCVSATYSSNSVALVTNSWYCAQFVGSTNTGYMFARWDGTAFVTTGGIVSAPIDLNFSKTPEAFASEIKAK